MAHLTCIALLPNTPKSTLGDVVVWPASKAAAEAAIPAAKGRKDHAGRYQFVIATLLL